MNDIRDEIVKYGAKTVQAGLVAGAGGNISAREGGIVWMKPSGLAMDQLSPDDLCGMDLETGRQQTGSRKPTTEVDMHLAVYRARPDVMAICHTHSPWASGVISSGVELKPMFAEFVVDLGRVGNLPYITPGTLALANAVGGKIKNHDTLFMANHGILAVGATMQQAYFRCVVVEDAGKSMVAATIVGKPRFLNKKQIKELLSLDRVRHRISVMSRK